MLKGKILLSAGGEKHDKNHSLKYSYFCMFTGVGLNLLQSVPSKDTQRMLDVISHIKLL